MPLAPAVICVPPVGAVNQPASVSVPLVDVGKVANLLPTPTSCGETVVPPSESKVTCGRGVEFIVAAGSITILPSVTRKPG